MKKFLCVFLALLFSAAVFSACRKDKPDVETTLPEDNTQQQETTEQVIADRKVTLGYFEGKGFNPYTTQSPVNRLVMTLVYDGLYVIDKNYTPVPVIAASATNEGTELTVQLAEELYFSDGEKISAADVVYSFNIAKNSSRYSASLSNFLSAKPTGDSVVFTLKRGDIYAESALVFPIIKTDSASDKIPTGSGRYTLKAEDGEYVLIANGENTRKEELNLEKLYLSPISAEEDELYLIQSGDLTYFYDDLSDGQYTKITANMYKTATNNLVFLTLNSNSPYFEDANLRQAVYKCLDINAACTNAYSGMSRTPVAPFNPDWYAVAGFEPDSSAYDYQTACSLLEKSGYIYAYSNNKYRSKNFEYIELDFLYCNESETKISLAGDLISNLEQAGIKINALALPYDEYLKALRNGIYDIYLGEVRLSSNMSLDSFFSEGGSTGYGINSSSVTATAYYDFISGTIDISTFMQVFRSEMPFIPLCYRDGMAYYSRELSFEGNVNEYEPFKDIYSWEV